MKWSDALAYGAAESGNWDIWLILRLSKQGRWKKQVRGFRWTQELGTSRKRGRLKQVRGFLYDGSRKIQNRAVVEKVQERKQEQGVSPYSAAVSQTCNLCWEWSSRTRWRREYRGNTGKDSDRMEQGCKIMWQKQSKWTRRTWRRVGIICGSTGLMDKFPSPKAGVEKGIKRQSSKAMSEIQTPTLFGSWSNDALFVCAGPCRQLSRHLKWRDHWSGLGIWNSRITGKRPNASFFGSREKGKELNCLNIPARTLVKVYIN